MTSLNFPNNPRRRVVSLILQMKELRHKVSLLACGRLDLNSNFPRETPYLGSGGGGGGGGGGSQAVVGVPSVGLWGTFSCATPFHHSSLLHQGPGRGLRTGVSAGGRDFRRGRYKAPRGRGAEESGEPGPKERGPAGSRDTTSLEALQAARQLQAPVARANCAELLPRGQLRGPDPRDSP